VRSAYGSRSDSGSQEARMSITTSFRRDRREHREPQDAEFVEAPPIEPGTTLVDLFTDRVARWPERPALRHVVDGEWQPITWAEYGIEVREAAAGLIALGVDAGDRVGLLAGNQPRWHIADLAIVAGGAISVPAYPTGAASQVQHAFGHSASRVCFVGD